jgi:hypothetical protein
LILSFGRAPQLIAELLVADKALRRAICQKSFPSQQGEISPGQIDDASRAANFPAFRVEKRGMLVELLDGVAQGFGPVAWRPSKRSASYIRSARIGEAAAAFRRAGAVFGHYHSEMRS